ncbi:MAG: YdcF family protein [Pontixanthobacter sp.]
MIRRFIAALLIAWAAGFAWFATTLPGSLEDGESEAVIVPTGAAGRIERGNAILDRGLAQTMLVTGVDPDVTPAEFAEQFDVPMERMECCVTLGFFAVDTRTNATETKSWLEQNAIGSIRFVTSDWHMRRASHELRRTIPPAIDVIEDPVPTEPSLRILFVEYHKLLAAQISTVWRD